jgi:GNAT superfamily N-acetyltransferase
VLRGTVNVWATGVTLVIGRCDPDAVAALLHGLPEWFGLEEATAAYIAAARTMPTVLAHDDGVVVGAVLWARHLPAAAEIHLMAVDSARHRRGIGTALLGRVEEVRRADGRALPPGQDPGPEPSRR